MFISVFTDELNCDFPEALATLRSWGVDYCDLRIGRPATGTGKSATRHGTEGNGGKWIRTRENRSECLMTAVADPEALFASAHDGV
jgi:hypothetical protein